MNEINFLPISFSTITFMSCQDRKISLNVGHFEKHKSSRAQVNYYFWLNLLENVQKYWKYPKIHPENQKIKTQFCFCSHFLPLRSLGLIFYMVEDNGICPLSLLNEQGLKRFSKQILSSPVLAPENLESNSQTFFSFTWKDLKKIVISHLRPYLFYSAL